MGISSYPDVSIVIPTFNGLNILKEFLPLVVRAADVYKGRTEIIIVDDGSTDESLEFLQNNFSKVNVLRFERNKGFGFACNEGIRSARSGIVILLNNDVLLDENFVEHIVPHFGNPDIFGVRAGVKPLEEKWMNLDVRDFTFKCYLKRGFITLEMVKIQNRHKPYYIPCLSGGAGAVMREKFLELGGFDELFAPFYWEDVDLSYRAWKRGWKILFEPQSVCYHRRHSTRKQYTSERNVSIISERNQYFLVWKNIHDKKMLYGHIAWVFLRSAISLVTGKWWKIESLIRALRGLRRAIVKRQKERMGRKVSDRELMRLFNEMAERSEPFFSEEDFKQGWTDYRGRGRVFQRMFELFLRRQK